MRRAMGLVLALALAGLFTACGDDSDVITATGPATSVPVERLTGDPEPYLRTEVIVRGIVKEVLPPRADRRALLVDDLLVIAPTADAVRAGDRVELEGNFHRLRADELSALGEVLGRDEQFLGDYDGRPTLFATRVERLG